MIIHKETMELCLIGWRKGAQKVTATEALMAHTHCGLSQAKGVIDRCLEGKTTVFSFNCLEDAQNLSRLLEEAGFETKIEQPEKSK